MKYEGKYIYKITNQINGKCYIGQSCNTEQRFKEHIRASSFARHESYDKPLASAMRKYGVHNFEFEVLGYFEDYNNKEIEMIALYNSLVTGHGYNISEGGDTPPVGVGGNKKYDDDVLLPVLDDLAYSDLTMGEIAVKHNISYVYVRELNRGVKRTFDEYSYPIRKTFTYKEREELALQIIEDLLHTSLTQKEIAQRHGVARSCVTMINIGKNHKQESIVYPIR